MIVVKVRSHNQWHLFNTCNIHRHETYNNASQAYTGLQGTFKSCEWKRITWLFKTDWLYIIPISPSYITTWLEFIQHFVGCIFGMLNYKTISPVPSYPNYVSLLLRFKKIICMCDAAILSYNCHSKHVEPNIHVTYWVPTLTLCLHNEITWRW